MIASPDDRFAFVSLEDAREIAVFDLDVAARSGFRRSGFVGVIPTGVAPVGMAIAPDGRWLYATSELSASARGRPEADSPGTLSIVNLRRAETEPARATIATVTAGCQPVRVAVAPDGSVVWVTARASDQLLGFAASRLTGARPADALIAEVPVGEAPVGLAVADGGRLVVVADSDRFDVPRQHAALTVVSTARALNREPAVLGSISSGAFPREMTLARGGRTLLVTDFASAQLEAVDLAHLGAR